MRLIAFPQWDKLTSLLRGMARQSAADYAQRKIVRIIPKNEVAHLANNAVNLLVIEGGNNTIIMPTWCRARRATSCSASPQAARTNCSSRARSRSRVRKARSSLPATARRSRHSPCIATGFINAVVVVGCCGRDGARPFWFGGGLGSGRGAPPCRAKCATFRSLCTIRGCTPRKILVNHQATGSWRLPENVIYYAEFRNVQRTEKEESQWISTN